MRTLTSYKRNWMLPLRYVLGIVALFPLLVLIGCVSISTGDADGTGSHDENQNHTFEVGDNPTIDVTGFNGEIEIVTGSDGVVDVETKLKIPNRVSYSATVFGNTVTIVAKKTGSGIIIGRSPQANIRLVVPARSTIEARTSNGPVNVTGIIGDGDLKTSNGKITIDGVTGTFDSSTSNGRVKITNSTGEFTAKTSNGRIEFSGSFSADGDNEFSTSNGSIDVEFTDEPNVELDAKTSNGGAHSALPILATTTERNHLIGKYGDGSASLELRTSNGSINVK
jgi:DUF4097 and DUF4098 domain-containing protein YvlB